MTIKNRILSAIVILLFNFSIANAQTFNKPTAYWGLNYYKYVEQTSGHDPFMEEETKVLPSILVGYKDETSINSKEKKNSLSWLAEATYGQVEYSQWTGAGTHTHNYWKIQGEALYPIVNNLYVGLGYRYLYDYLSDAGAGGYDRSNELFYIPAGYVLNNTDGSRTKLQFNYLIEGTQKSYVTDYGASNDLTNKQHNGWGLDLSYTPTSGNWEIFGKYWNIQATGWGNTYTYGGTTYTGLEPDNQTYEIGVRLAF